ncbi:peptidylprolyl isomerase, partial [Acinetobacter baumannii]|nr:peptidylprolyl isomerase [Acinetobacter baumannii]
DQYNVKKDETPAFVNVRHILIKPEVTEGAEGPTDEQKEAARAKAQDILDQWKAGNATEESFGALAKEHTEDPGSKEAGG